MNRWALLAGYQLTGLALAVSENLQRASVLPLEYRVTLKHTFVMLLAAGTVLGIVRVALRGVIRALRLRPEPCYALIAGALSYLTWSELTSGAWISAQWYAPYLPLVLALAVAGGLWIATLLLRRLPAPKPALAPAVLALAACALAFADARVLVGLYPSLHEALLLVLWLCGGEACAMAIAQRVAPERHARRRVVLAVLACSLSLSLPIAWQKGTALQQRAVWMRAPGHAKVVYELGPSLVRRATRSRRDPSAYPASREDWVDVQPNRARLTRPLALRAWSTLRDTQRQRAAVATAAPASDARGGKRPNIILISVDALRADVALKAPTGAFQSELVAKARVYRRAYAASAATHISLGTLVTGWSSWQSQEHNIIVRLNAARYDTMLVTHRHVKDWLRAKGQRWVDDIAMDALVDPEGGTTSKPITAAALRWLNERESDAPFLLWLHYYDVHEWNKLPGAGDRPIAQQYERTWRLVETSINAFLEGARQSFANHPTVLLFVADHGEYVGEEGREGHGRWLGMPNVHIPMLLVAPGYDPAEVSRPVALIDVAPTIAQLAGLHGGEPFEGTSLLAERADPLRPLVMAESLEIALARGDHRVVLNPSAQLLQAFDESDPSAIKELPLSTLPRLEEDFLLPLLGSPAASGNTSRLDEH